MNYKQYFNILVVVVFIGALSGLTACKNNVQPEDSRVFPTMTITSSSAEIIESYTASIRGRQDVEIYPQVSGKIVRLCVVEGERVKHGQPLFIIDQVPYLAALRTATANVHAALAQLSTARLEHESKQELYNAKVVSEYELITSSNALAVAQAALEQVRAEEMNARNNLSYTVVKSPADGTVGTLPFRCGALVSPSMSQPLTTISDNQEMYVYFSMTENQLRGLVQQYGSPDEAIAKMPPVKLELSDGSSYESEGRIKSISGIVDPQTGTVSVCSVFPNKRKWLWRGGIGNIVISLHKSHAIVVPLGVVGELQDKLYAFKVVDGKAVRVFISITKLSDGKSCIVHSGLRSGDTVVTEGGGLLKNGMPIKTKTNLSEQK